MRRGSRGLAHLVGDAELVLAGGVGLAADDDAGAPVAVDGVDTEGESCAGLKRRGGVDAESGGRGVDKVELHDPGELSSVGEDGLEGAGRDSAGRGASIGGIGEGEGFGDVVGRLSAGGHVWASAHRAVDDASVASFPVEVVCGIGGGLKRLQWIRDCQVFGRGESPILSAMRNESSIDCW